MKNQKLNHILLWIIAIIISVLVTSCGTRKVEQEKHENIVVENTYQEGSKIVLGNSFIYKPFDNLKPMVIDGKTYTNTVISNDKTKTIEKWKTRYITKTITLEKTKKTEKSDNTILWIGIAFVVCLFIFLWFYLPKFKI